MDRSEVLGVLSILKTAFPGFYRGMDRKEAENAVALWCDLFRDDNAAQVGMAVKAFIQEDQKGFPPTPGQIKAKMPKNHRAISGPTNISPEMSEYQQKYAELVKRRRAAGLPATLDDAKKAGLTNMEWAKMMDDAGYGSCEIIEEIWGRSAIL